MLDKNLVDREKKLEDLIAGLESKKSGGDCAKVRASYVNGRAKYFICREGDNEFSYAKKRDLPQVREFAQKNYEEKILSVANDELKAIERLLKVRKNDTVESIYSRANEARRNILDPVAMDNEDYAKAWEEEEFQTAKSVKIKKTFCTERGDMVRTESDSIIADCLYERGIPYRYGCPVVASNAVIYPDFTILDKTTRNVFILENFSFMDDKRCRENFYRKVNYYASIGFVFGKNFIATFEDDEKPVDRAVVDKIISEVFECDVY